MAVDDYAATLNGVMWFQVAIAIVLVAARMYTRQAIIHSVGWDDVLMLVNLITFILYVVCVSVGTTHGLGKKHAAVPDPAEYSKAVMWEALGQGICIMGIAASKASVALFLLRIVVKRWHIAVLWFCIASTTILCIITTTLLFVQCKPSAFLWDQTIEGGYCWLNFTNVGLSMASWSAFMDFVLAILPWHIVMGLNMKRKEKLTVAFGLSLGIFAGICSIVRTVEITSLSSQKEYVYDTVSMLLWSSTEVLMSIMCACIPVLRPLYIYIVRGSRGGSSDENSRSYRLRSYSKKGQSSDTKGRSVTDTKIYLGPGTSALRTTVKGYDSSNISEESILRETHEQQKKNQTVEEEAGNIRRTDEVHVTYGAGSIRNDG